MKRLSDHFGRAGADLADCAFEAQSIRDLLHQVFPLRLRYPAKGEAHRNLPFSGHGVFYLRIERAVLAQLTLDLKGLGAFEGWIEGSSFQLRGLVSGHYQCLFIAQRT